MELYVSDENDSQACESDLRYGYELRVTSHFASSEIF